MFTLTSRKIKKKHRKHISILSMCYILLFYYQIIINCLVFQPLLISVVDTTPPNASVCYILNQMGGYVWNHPNQNQNYTLDNQKNTLFYINAFHGNCSTRFNVIQRFHSYLPSSYQIVQFDHPGFGLSSYLKTDSTTIFTSVAEAINLFMKEQEVKDSYAIFTEFEASLIISQMYSKLTYKPSHIIHFNPTISLFDHLRSKYTMFSTPLFLPYLFQRTITQWYDKNQPHTTNFAILENNEKNKGDDGDNTKSLSIGEEIVLNLPINFDRKKLLKLDGEGIASLLSDCNRKLLTNFFDTFLMSSNITDRDNNGS